MFAAVAWHVPSMIEAMWEASDYCFGSICQLFVDRWWRGRAVLLGDDQAAMRAYVAARNVLARQFQKAEGITLRDYASPR